MRLLDRVRAARDAFFDRSAIPAGSPVYADLADLPLQDYSPPPPAPPIPLVEATVEPDPGEALTVRREAATSQALEARAAARQAATEASMPMGGILIDPDDNIYRRLTNGAKFQRRDLSPLQQDRMLEIAWYLWEQNPFARRLITLMTDLILGEGWVVEVTDDRFQDEIDKTWNHRVNQIAVRIREFANALFLNGEILLPVATNPYTGRPQIGFLDPYQVKDIRADPSNILVPDLVVLKTTPGQPEQTMKIVRENPLTGEYEGEVFYFGINKLPNSLRGRSDLMPLADWLDLYDQYLFAEVERLHLLSAFVWDYKIEGATSDKEIQQKLAKFPTPKPGSVFAHNEKETLEARTPDLKAQDRSEAGRMLRTHIAGSYGFPLSYLGEIDSNRATIEGQNDTMLKTPAARQIEFSRFLDQIVRFTISSTRRKNPILFRDADPGYKIRMPEIKSKDIARVGTVLAQVVTAMDTSMANKTASRKLTAQVLVAMLRQLGVEADPNEVLADADLEADERQALADEIQAEVARQRSLNPDDDDGSGQPPRPPNPDPPDTVERRPEAIHVHPSIHVEAPVVSVKVPDVTVVTPAPVPVRREQTVERDPTTRLVTKTTTTETPLSEGRP